MRRLIATAAVAGLGAVGFLALPTPAKADPVICISLDLNLNGTPLVQAICLPPEGAPGVPGLPALPGVPALPLP